MVDLSLQERLQPSLLDRLTDNEPKKIQESRDERVLSSYQLRRNVLRDLVWLLNCTSLGSTQDLDGYPEVKNSVLNYGLADMAGRTESTLDSAAVEYALLEAIRIFEPRILPNTLKLRLLSKIERQNPNSVAFEIEGELWSQPIPQRLYLQTELDIEVGNVHIDDRLGSG
jgi:type VI secretion system protein ImpF